MKLVKGLDHETHEEHLGQLEFLAWRKGGSILQKNLRKFYCSSMHAFCIPEGQVIL